MGLGKTKGSTRINRYEQQASATSFDSLGELAQALNVPPAYLLADNAAMADAILAQPNGSAPKTVGELADFVTALR